jgi:hypothetical protein
MKLALVFTGDIVLLYRILLFVYMLWICTVAAHAALVTLPVVV